jgi:dienelactone hydrolase
MVQYRICLATAIGQALQTAKQPREVFMQQFINYSLLCLIGALVMPVFVFAQAFQVSPPNPVLTGQPMSIKLTGLVPKTTVTVTSERAWNGFEPSAKIVLYQAQAQFIADGNGQVDLATGVPIENKLATGGTYKKADIRGLFWSMQPTQIQATAEQTQAQIKLTATQNDKIVASHFIVMESFLSDLKVQTVAQFPGSIFAMRPSKIGQNNSSAVPAKRPAIIVLGGSEGGASSVNDSAKRLASLGFATISLPYYSPPQWPSRQSEVAGLPTQFVDIPIEQLNQVREYLRSRDDVDGDHIAIYGVSKGAEFVLLAAVHFPWVKTVVAIVPSDVVWEGWGEGISPNQRSSFAFNGKPFAFTPYKDFGQEFQGYQTGEPVYIRRPQDRGRAANPAAAAAARIQIEQYKGALLVVAGQDDQVWNSAMMAHNIAERRAAANLPIISLIYSDAGHYLSGTGWSPTTQYNMGLGKSGGTPEGNATAQGDAWLKTINFLKRQLKLADGWALAEQVE